MVEIKKILFPIDFTENSSKILPHVLSISDKYASEVCLIHVVEDLCKWVLGIHVPHSTLEKYQREAVDSAEKAMDRICDEQLRGCPRFKRIIVSGDPVQEILKTVETENIDLIIMGTHGRKGMDHVIFGSVAENVVKKSSAPVLTVNPNKLR